MAVSASFESAKTAVTSDMAKAGVWSRQKSPTNSCISGNKIHRLLKKAVTWPWPCSVIRLERVIDGLILWDHEVHETAGAKSDLKEAHPYQVEKQNSVNPAKELQNKPPGRVATLLCYKLIFRN